MITMRKLINVIVGICFIAGLGLVGYSGFEIWQGNKMVEEKTVEAKEILTRAETIDPKNLTKEQIEEIENKTYIPNEAIGLLGIPKLEKEVPIIEGTDADDLKKGVGHYNGTSFPLQDGQVVLSGHRDTVFRNFDQLEVGDTFEVHMDYGTFEYEIYEVDIVPAGDTTVIGSIHEENLTVTTCYPFSYIGNAPDRAVFYAKPTFETTTTLAE